MIKSKIKNFVYNKDLKSVFKIAAKSILLIFSLYVKIKNVLYIIYNFLIIIIFLSKNKKKEVIIIHDLLSSPQTIGDFLNNYFFARYFVLKNYKVKLIVIKNEYRLDWDLNEIKINNYISTITKIINKLSKNFQNFELVITDWSHFDYIYLNNKCYYIPFKNGIEKRFKLYFYTQNVLNYLLSISNQNFINNFLLDKKDFNDNNKFPINKKYIAWHCRYDNTDGTPRNIDRVSFDKIYHTLKKYYQNYNILIVSDKLGCDITKEWGLNYNLLYSKDYSNDFLGDVKLVLNSEFYFQFRGGGMGTIAQFSKIPYLQIIDIYYLSMFSKYKLNSNSSQDQVVFNRNVLCEFSEEYFEKYTKIII